VPPTIRQAEPRDLLRLEDIENEADTLFLERFHPEAWRRAPTAEERLASGGFVLVAADMVDGDAVGFAHVLPANDAAHLEQLSVLPSHGRRGHGRALVEAAKRDAYRRGFRMLTLRTFADVPWNAPFYYDCGFVETKLNTPFHAALLDAEIATGTLLGRRIAMVCELSRS
jgi:GNAT superfamily N-acetyltransferase